MITILVTAIGGDVGCGVLKALHKSKYNLTIIGCDINTINYSLDLVDKFIVAPPYSDENRWLDFIKSKIDEYDVDYFWPVTEDEIRIVQKNKNKFDLDKVVMNSLEILDIALDKGNTALQLERYGVKVPDTWFSVEKADTLYTFPVIVKERNGCGSHGVKIVDNNEDLASVFYSMDNPIIQEYIGSPEEEYTMGVFSDGIIVNNIAFRRRLGPGGFSVMVELCNDETLDVMACKIANALALKGSINVQMRKQNGQYYVFEINPRISSTISFRLLLGFNDVEWWLDMKENRKIKKFKAPKENLFGVRNVEEKIFFRDCNDSMVLWENN